MGLNYNDINEITKALQWQLDFRKLRKGDKFSIIVSKTMVNEKDKKNQLLGVRLQTKGKDYYAFRAKNGKFYNQDATGPILDFINLPTERKFRISSKFNLQRINPITRSIVPHRGVDFAMPIGTPILAVDDGKVIVSKKEKNCWKLFNNST